MSEWETWHTGGPGSLTDICRMSHFISICCCHSRSEQTSEANGPTPDPWKLNEWPSQQREKGAPERLPSMSVQLQGEEKTRRYWERRGERYWGGKKVGKIISTQPCPHNCPGAGTLSFDLIPSRNYTGQDPSLILVDSQEQSKPQDIKKVSTLSSPVLQEEIKESCLDLSLELQMPLLPLPKSPDRTCNSLLSGIRPTIIPNVIINLTARAWGHIQERPSEHALPLGIAWLASTHWPDFRELKTSPHQVVKWPGPLLGLRQGFSAFAPLTFWAGGFSVVGAVQCTGVCLVASLASTHETPVAAPQWWQSKGSKCPWGLPPPNTHIPCSCWEPLA